MWQRIQTLFLLVVITSLAASIFLPIWAFQDPLGQKHILYALHYSTTENNITNTQYFPYAVTGILAIAALTIAVISIGKYKNRLLQMKLGALNSLFMAGTIASAVIFSNQLIKTFQGGVYGLGLWIPGIAVVANLASNFFIRRDERLVRDSNRLR
jgi:type IV secretory pathway TrbD component